MTLGLALLVIACTGESAPVVEGPGGIDPALQPVQTGAPSVANPTGGPGGSATPPSLPPAAAGGSAPVFPAEMPLKPPPSMKVDSITGDEVAGWEVAGVSAGSLDEVATLFADWLTANQITPKRSEEAGNVSLEGELPAFTVRVSLVPTDQAVTTAITVRPK